MTQARDYQVYRKTTGSDPRISYTVSAPQEDFGATLVFASGTGLTQDCWQYRWTDYFAQRGLGSITLDYRAHGASSWSQRVQDATLQGDVDDITSVIQAEGLDARRVILVGHSMGGGIALRYAEQHELLGLVVMGAFAFGLWEASSRAMFPYLALRHPLVLLQAGKNPSVLFNTKRRAREFLLGNADEETVQACLKCIGPESSTVLSEIVKVKPQPLRVTPEHILFLAATDDRLAPVSLVRQSAESMHARFEQVEGPHMVMMGQAWEAGADEVCRFAQTCANHKIDQQ